MRRLSIAVSAGLGVLIAALALIWVLLPSFSEDEVRQTVITTIQEEAPASFLVTGTLRLAVTKEVTKTEHAFPRLAALIRMAQPSWPAFDQGTARAAVRVPGRVSYGFDVQELRPEAIRVHRDGLVEVTLPDLQIHAVEPDLAALEVKTSSTGWMRLFESSAEGEVKQKALAGAQEVLRAQAQQRINDAAQPRINTARALQTMLTPVLVAAGVPDPQFRFQIGPELVMMPNGESAIQE